MKRIAFLTFALAAAFSVQAQVADPVIMVINGQPVTRSEFEYSYNKNTNIEGAVEQKSLEEYADMFINYKLKVVAAEEAQLDTLSSFRREFYQYRDMQLTPFLIDTVYIDSIAHAVYQRTVDQMQGKDMLHLSHILIPVKQSDGEDAVKRARQTTDSIATCLKNGEDFATLAKKYSQDPGSARNGGELPWIGPGMVIKEFEDEAYKLKNGETSAPVQTSFGFHIIHMIERKQLDPFDTLRNEILSSLRRQGIEEQSAEERINKIVKQSNGTLTREAVLDSVLAANIEGGNNDLRYLVQEYHDGLLLYEISKRTVWDPAQQDSMALESLFSSHKSDYAWTEPHFKGYVVYAKSAKGLKKAVKALRKATEANWRNVLKETVNKDSIEAKAFGPYLVKKGENPVVDWKVFGGNEAKQDKKFPNTGVAGKTLKQPKSYKDVKTEVVNDLQDRLMNDWIASLRKKYSVVVNRDVLSTVNKH